MTVAVKRLITGAPAKRRRRHGYAAAGRSPEYRTWEGIKKRCHDPKQPGYRRYGARGIRVCDRWRESFEAFLADMGPKPSPTHSIDRIDNARGYEPGNCRWATRAEQNNNTCRTIRLTHNGETLTLAEWAERLGVRRKTLATRVQRGWTVAETLTTPMREWCPGRPKATMLRLGEVEAVLEEFPGTGGPAALRKLRGESLP